MLNDFLSDHISPCHLALLRKFIPKLKVLVELGPAFGHSRRNQAEQVVQEIEKHLIVRV